MSLSTELSALFRRDLARIIQELQALPDDELLWRTTPGCTNSVGNLTLHLEGNLNDFVGRQLGNIPYTRQRDLEFSSSGVSRDTLIQRMQGVLERVPPVVANLSDADLEATYPQQVLGMPLSTRQFLIHLHGHFNLHLGQIDYLRRMLTEGAAVKFAGLSA